MAELVLRDFVGQRVTTLLNNAGVKSLSDLASQPSDQWQLAPGSRIPKELHLRWRAIAILAVQMAFAFKLARLAARSLSPTAIAFLGTASVSSAAAGLARLLQAGSASGSRCQRRPQRGERLGCFSVPDQLQLFSALKTSLSCLFGSRERARRVHGMLAI
jgi:hypothetical protein